MNTGDLGAWLADACHRLTEDKDELTGLDAAAGDGDLGVTVASGATAVAAALGDLPPGASPAEIVRAAAAAFARGNPSSFAALSGAGLLAAAHTLDGTGTVSRESLVAALRTAADRIAQRGRSELGQRTVLDALVPSIEALAKAPPGLAAGLDAMIAAARSGTAATREMTAARGRAAWVGDRSRGIADAGATAYLRFLEALSQTLPARTV
jgi:phosphoenolpyruvate---glycerone phosphotransferase subunit DhaL